MHVHIHVSVENRCVHVCATAWWTQVVNIEYLVHLFPTLYFEKGCVSLYLKLND